MFESADIVKNMNPNQELLIGIEGRIQNATAKGTDVDCVSRSFCPKLSIAEDPVCGSAHCQIAAYWAEKGHFCISGVKARRIFVLYASGGKQNYNQRGSGSGGNL